MAKRTGGRSAGNDEASQGQPGAGME